MLLCGFGVGLSWGSCLVRASGLRAGAISDYRGDIAQNYAADYSAHWRKIFEGKESR